MLKLGGVPRLAWHHVGLGCQNGVIRVPWGGSPRPQRPLCTPTRICLQVAVMLPITLPRLRQSHARDQAQARDQAGLGDRFRTEGASLTCQRQHYPLRPLPSRLRKCGFREGPTFGSPSYQRRVWGGKPRAFTVGGRAPLGSQARRCRSHLVRSRPTDLPPRRRTRPESKGWRCLLGHHAPRSCCGAKAKPHITLSKRVFRLGAVTWSLGGIATKR